MARDLYIPIPLIEALGRSAVALAQLELSFDILLTILRAEPGRYDVCLPGDPFEAKIRALATASRSRLLKHEWWQTLRRTARRAEVLHQDYSCAAMAGVYSRGGGSLEELMKALAERVGVAPKRLLMTAAKIDKVGEEAGQLAMVSSNLAASLLDAAQRMSIRLEGLPDWQH